MSEFSSDMSPTNGNSSELEVLEKVKATSTESKGLDLLQKHKIYLSGMYQGTIAEFSKTEPRRQNIVKELNLNLSQHKGGLQTESVDNLLKTMVILDIYHLHGKPGNSSWKIKWFTPFHLGSFRTYGL